MVNNISVLPNKDFPSLYICCLQPGNGQTVLNASITSSHPNGSYIIRYCRPRIIYNPTILVFHWRIWNNIAINRPDACILFIYGCCGVARAHPETEAIEITVFFVGRRNGFCDILLRGGIKDLNPSILVSARTKGFGDILRWCLSFSLFGKVVEWHGV